MPRLTRRLETFGRATSRRRAVIHDDSSSPPVNVPAKRKRQTKAIKSESQGNETGPTVPVKAPRKRKKTAKYIISDDEDQSALAKKANSKLHIHTNAPRLEDEYFTQLPTVSSSPWRLRGARWQKQAVVDRKQAVVDTKPAIPLSPIAPNLAPIAPNSQTHRKFDEREFHCSAEEDVMKNIENCVPIDLPAMDKHSYDVANELADLPSDAFDDDIGRELAGLPSDAFESSADENFGETNIAQPPPLERRVAPTSGLKQTTLLGHLAGGSLVPAQSTKRMNWPKARVDEPPTHHALNTTELRTYIYPTNLGKIRDYQYSIVKRALFHNTLVALPTGLGKTFIAATVMLNWLRWTTTSQIVFVAPTKPLVSQQVEACFGIAGISRSITSMLTGGISPGLRAEEWATKRVFFMTPQTIINDLKTGICDPKRIVLLVVDEAHRATGNYAYVEIVKFLQRFNQSLRVLALTATPGASVDSVQEVINGLNISRVEIRTEFSIDIREFVHHRRTDMMTFDYSEEMEVIMELFSAAVKPTLSKLTAQNCFWTSNPMALTAYGLTQARQKWMATAGRNANAGLKGMLIRIFSVLASLAHGVELLKFHGIGPFYHNIVGFRNSLDGLKGGKYEKDIANSEPFVKMMNKMAAWVKHDAFVGHPKLERLQELVVNHFLDVDHGRDDRPVATTRVMIFAHYRDSAEEIARVLKRSEPMVRPHVFVGQAASKGSEGMDQKQQLKVIEEFKAGKFNTLVATSIGEEGLDIGEIDLIVCYDSSASPIRMLQRMGRTGRKRAGRIVLLLMKEKEEKAFLAAKDNYEKMQQIIAAGDQFDFHTDSVRRILPRGIEPTVDMRMVEIPKENSQGLPEPAKKGRPPKRPQKRFNMPDGVETGFVQASRVGDEPLSKRARRAPPELEEEDADSGIILESIPSYESVSLDDKQKDELLRNYQILPAGENIDFVVSRPELDRHPSHQRFSAPTFNLKHGRGASGAVSAFQYMSEMTLDRAEELARVASSLSEISSSALHRISDPADVRVTAHSFAPSNKRPAPKSKARMAALATPVSNRYRTSASSDMEAPESSAPATSPGMGLPTQGIDLGSDTSGEDDSEGEPSSELQDFVAADDASILAATSSAINLFDNDSGLDLSDEEDFGIIGQADKAVPAKPGRSKRRMVIHDSSDVDD